MLSRTVELAGYSAKSSHHGKAEENLFFSSWPSLLCTSILLYIYGTNATPPAQTTYPIPTPPVFLSKPWEGLLRWSLDSSGHSSASLSIPLRV